MQNGFINIAAGTPLCQVADVSYNTEQISLLIEKAVKQQIQLIVFPELSVTSASCGHLFYQQTLLSQTEEQIKKLIKRHASDDIVYIIGAPIKICQSIYNCAIICHKKEILGIIPQSLNNKNTIFADGKHCKTVIKYVGISEVNVTPDLIINLGQEVRIGTVIGDAESLLSQSMRLTNSGANIICNPAAVPNNMQKSDITRQTLLTISRLLHTTYIYSNCGFGESTQDTTYSAMAQIYEYGELLAQSEPYNWNAQVTTAQTDIMLIDAIRTRYSINSIEEQCCTNISKPVISSMATGFKITRQINPLPFIPQLEQREVQCNEILEIQAMGLAKRLRHIHSDKVILGISGGLDSTMALLACVHAFKKLGIPNENIIGITMPGFGTTQKTKNNATQLMKSLQISYRTIDITGSVQKHFKDIDHDPKIQNHVYENAQARERTQILMDLGNKLNALVVGTGDLSELALGWATYNGDHMSMYGINAGLPKTLIREVISYVAENKQKSDRKLSKTLKEVLDTPISPELLPANEDETIKQKTEELIGPYPLHDFFLYHMVNHGFSPEKIYQLALKAFDGTDTRVSKYTPQTIQKWLTVFTTRFFTQQFKRSCMPDGPQITPISLSPRGGWMMPSDTMAQAWIEACHKLTKNA